jgi:hypothetical protein
MNFLSPRPGVHYVRFPACQYILDDCIVSIATRQGQWAEFEQ